MWVEWKVTVEKHLINSFLNKLGNELSDIVIKWLSLIYGDKQLMVSNETDGKLAKVIQTSA